MELQKIAVKVFADGGKEIPLPVFIDVFHKWIQASDGVYHDVADYSHMQAGPGVVLIANEANVSIDEAENRRGLLYSRKAHLDGSNQEKFRAVLRSALDNCRRLEGDAALCGKLTFPANEIAITINDRLVAPNTEATFAALKPELKASIGEVFGCENFAVKQNSDERKRFSVTVRAPVPLGLQKS